MYQNAGVAETSGLKLRSWLLLALEDLGGSGPRQAVHSKVEQLFGDQFTSDDIAPRVGRRGEAAWRNNLDSLYDRMKKSGHLETVAARQPWTLAQPGSQEVLALAPVTTSAPPPVDEDALLANFKPGDPTAYLAHLRGRILLKPRTHEDVLDAYGRGIARRGWAPTTAVHPRDLELQRGNDDVCLAEVKMVYNGNAARAVREAVGQLLEYRHFHYAPDARPVLLAVFSEPVGAAFTAYLQSLGIASVWRDGSAWAGSQKATRLDLVP